MKKKILALVLSGTMVFSGSAAVFAADTTTDSTAEASLEAALGELLSGEGEGVDLEALVGSVTDENGELDIEGLLGSVTGSEDGSVDLSSLLGSISGSEDGSFDLSSLLGSIFGGEDGSFDLDAINKAVTDDDSYFENKALEMGVSVDVARKLEQADALEQQRQEAEQKARRDAMLREHFANVQAQARALQEIVPGFSLEKEMQDPEFVKRTAPGGLSVEDAFFSLHHKEIMQQQAEAIARRSKQAAAAAVQSGSARPRENGSSATAAVSATPNMRSMSRADRLAYIKSKYPPRT